MQNSSIGSYTHLTLSTYYASKKSCINLCCTIHFAVPGPVSNFTAKRNMSSILFDWGPPFEPNGILIVYQLTYTVTGSGTVIHNLTDIAATELAVKFPQNITVSQISLRAYTSAGPGEASTTVDFVIPVLRKLALMVMLFMVYVSDISSCCEKYPSSTGNCYFSDSVLGNQ